jgi:hypothetical protein
MGAEDWERARILLGRPAPGAELTADFNPLEAGLYSAVSVTKGAQPSPAQPASQPAWWPARWPAWWPVLRRRAGRLSSCLRPASQPAGCGPAPQPRRPPSQPRPPARPGCYIGQETIAKLNNTGGVRQQLWGVQLSQMCAPGAEVQVDGARVGVVTSVTDTPDGEFYALAYIKSKSRGAQLTLEGAPPAFDRARL